jgi:hypothetical protein
MIKLVTFLFLLSTMVIATTETRGILSIEDPSITSLTVGESYRYKLTLVPFEAHLISKKALEGQKFLENFYINEVLSIKTSQNNYDAVVISLDLTLVKAVELKPFYIWNLVDRNIPVDVPTIKVNDVALVQKNFSLLKTPSISFKSKYQILYGVGALALACLLAFVFWRLNRNGKNTESFSYKRLLSQASKRKDLEELYFSRHKIYEKLKDETQKKKLEDFFNSYRLIQFSPEWSSQDISQLVERANTLARELDNGV